MLNILLVLLVPIALLAFAAKMARAYETPDYTPPLVPMMLIAYLLRVLMFYVGNEVKLFSHDVGGDWAVYQYNSELINAIWDRSGMHYVTDDEIPIMGTTTLPPNFFALITYFNGGEPAREGCSAMSALFVGVTAMNLFSLCIELGTPVRRAAMMAALPLFLPGCVLYSSDMYKDPMVWLLTFGMLASSIRLIRRLTARDVIIAVLCSWGLWHVRFYLVFLTVAPLVVGLLGLNTKNPGRTLLILLAAIGVMLPILAYSQVFSDFSEQANATFDVTTSESVRVGTAMTAGSGVTFDDGGNAFGALPQKIAYTLFAPFPWQFGSIAMHIGKIDALAGTYCLWRAVKGGKVLLRTHPALLFALLTFALPTTLAYAMAMNNVGTILRQRIPVILVAMLLAGVSWADEDAPVVAAEPDDDESEDSERADPEDDAAPEPV